MSWELRSDRRGARQTARQIVASGDGLAWDSGRVASGESVGVPYGGPPLRSRQRVTWKVRVWNERGAVSKWSAPATFEMGLLSASDWQARWIGAPWVGGPKTPAICPVLRKTFRVSRPVASARLYVTALGVYECELNGRRVSEDVLAPGWTDYRHRIQYQVYDVAPLLRRGRNRWSPSWATDGPSATSAG